MKIKDLLKADIRSIPMKAKHKALGRAAFYLDAVVHSGTIPGIHEDVVYAMDRWGVKTKPDEIKACLAGIWYLSVTGNLIDGNPTFTGILSYLDDIARGGEVHKLVGVKPFSEVEFDKWSVEDVQNRLHILMGKLPVMENAYRKASRSKKYRDHPFTRTL